MARNIIKYVGLVLVVIGIIIVMKNLLASDTEWQETSAKTNTKSTYNVTVSLLDKGTKSYITDSKLVVKDSQGNVIDEWTTSNGVHLISKVKNGTYTLTQESTNSNYSLDKNGVTFKVSGKDKKVSMYNTALTEEEKKNSTSSVGNNQVINPDEQNVESTSSFKNPYMYIIALISIVSGSAILYKVRQDNI